MSDKRINLRIVGTTPTDAEFEAARQRAAKMFNATIKTRHRATVFNGRTICTCGDFNCASLDVKEP